jgi:hypothetical protein
LSEYLNLSSELVDLNGQLLGGSVGIAIGLLALGGWLQHLYTCFTQGLWGFLIAGAVFFPVGVIHGWESGWEFGDEAPAEALAGFLLCKH